MGPNGGLGGGEKEWEDGAKNKVVLSSRSSSLAVWEEVREWARVGVRVVTDSVSVKGEETLEMTWVGASGVCVRDVNDCTCFISIREGAVQWKWKKYIIYRVRHTPFVCIRDYSDSPPHTRALGGVMHVISPFVD
jgi:hypothetical protein